MTRTQVVDAIVLIRRVLEDDSAPVDIAQLADLELRVRDRTLFEQAKVVRRLAGIEATRKEYLP